MRFHKCWNMAWDELLFCAPPLSLSLCRLHLCACFHFLFLFHILHVMWIYENKNEYMGCPTEPICGSVIKLSNQFNQCAEGNPLPYRFKYIYIHSRIENLFSCLLSSIFSASTRFWMVNRCVFSHLYFLFPTFIFTSYFVGFGFLPLFFIPFAWFSSLIVSVRLKYTAIC